MIIYYYVNVLFKLLLREIFNQLLFDDLEYYKKIFRHKIHIMSIIKG